MIFNFSEDKIDDAIESFMSEIPGVNCRQDEFHTTENLIEIFRKGFGLEEHNTDFSAEESILCYDLMICRNPLDDNKQQKFYTFFSKKDVYEDKVELAKIYTYYLEKDKEKHVDTLLQICYSKDYATEVRDGFYIDFSNPNEMSLHLIRDHSDKARSVFQWYGHDLENVKKIINDKTKPIEQTVEGINNYIEERWDAFGEKSGFDFYVTCRDETEEYSGFSSYVDAFLNKKKTRSDNTRTTLTKRDIQKNAYLISIINQLAVPGIKYLYFFPVPSTNGGQIGHFVLSTTEPFHENRNYLRKFKFLSYVLINPLVQEVVTSQQFQKIKELLVRSSLAQIMARNLSHNYGSHVLNHLLSANLSTFSVNEDSPYKSKYEPKLTDLAKETCNQIVFLLKRMSETAPEIWEEEETCPKIKQLIEQCVEIFKAHSNLDAKNITSESLRQVVYLLNHIKCRVDYISDISFGAPMLQTSRYVYNDIFKEIDKVGLLMNHISGLEEDFKYSIVVSKPDAENAENKELSENNDFQVAIPNDVVGTHAFYNILENIIRNTAKHSSGNQNDEVVFHIDFSDIEKKNVVDEDVQKESEKYYCVEIYDNIEQANVEALVDNLNKQMNEPIYDKDRPRSHSLGIVEMEASAAYLRKLDSVVINDEQYHVVNKKDDGENGKNTFETYKDSYDNPNGKLNLLKAFSKDGKHLGYRFFMLRPQEVLVVSDNKEVKKLHNAQKGIWTMGGEEFRTELKNGMVFNHEFVVIGTTAQDTAPNFTETETALKNHSTALSPRILKLDVQNWITEKSDGQAINLVEGCWAQWNTENDSKWPLKYFRPSYNKTNNKETAVYKHHLKEQTDKESIEKCEYAEALSSLAFDKLPDAYKLADEKSKDTKYVSCLSDLEEGELTFADYCRNRESVNNKVLVIDERIQDAAEKFVYGKGACVLPFSTYYKKMGVTVPCSKEINLSEKDFGKDLSKDYKVKDLLKDYMDKESKDKDFMLIHYGILERIFKIEDKVNWYEKMEEFLKDLASQEKAPRIVITSGRGVPGKLPEQVCFVSLSSVTHSLIDYKSKYLLNCLLYAARKTNH